MAGFTVLLVAQCPVHIEGDAVRIDRKFHTGMVAYADRLPGPIACLLPAASRETVDRGIDPVSVSRSDLPYEILPVPQRRREPLRLIWSVVSASRLVYLGESGWMNRKAARQCRRHDIPYAVTLEYCLGTELAILRVKVSNLIRRTWRAARLLAEYPGRLRLIAGAAEAHANGYPTHLHEARWAPRRYLFLDTRARAEDVIPIERLRARLAERRERGFRLIYSGRLERMKGTIDLVRAGLDLADRRRDFRLDIYGSGSVRGAMQDLIAGAGAGERIVIHEPVPYPELVEITRASDLFLCCHVQGDPSCSYLETMACGVPTIGYANATWTEECENAGAGEVTRRSPFALADAVDRVLEHAGTLDAWSLAARRFALVHTMEAAWELRTTRLRELLGESVGAVRSAGAGESATRRERHPTAVA